MVFSVIIEFALELVDVKDILVKPVVKNVLVSVVVRVDE